MEQGAINLSEILQDPRLSKAVAQKLTSYKNSYYYPGTYKRSPIYTLIESKNYNAGYFIDEFIKVTTKSCKLPKGQRDIIVSIVGDAMHDLWLKNQRENGNKKESGSESPNSK